MSNMPLDNFEIIQGSKSDFSAIAQLLDKVNLPTEGVAEHIENFLVIFDKENTSSDSLIIGCVGLEIYQKNALLRSLAVHPTKQKIGLGNALADAVVEYAKKKGMRNLFLRTDTAEHFFVRKGFHVISLKEIPDSIKQSVEFDSSVCSESATNMKLSLNK